MVKLRVVILIILFAIVCVRLYQTPRVRSPHLQSLDQTGYGSYFTGFRQVLAEKISDNLPQPQAGLLVGILIGVKASLPPEFKAALTNTSTVHIVVASGQNLTLISGFILALSPFLGRKKSVLLSIIVSLIYSFVTGLQIPIIRAAIMVSFAGVARLVNREAEDYFVLILTALLMLVFNPVWLYSVSFQLSFLATIGVVVVAPELIKMAKCLPGVIRENLMVSLSAQVLTAPVIAANFHQFSLVGLLANTLVLWTVPFIMIFGASALALSFIASVFGPVLMLVPAILLTYFVYIIAFLNQSWVSLRVEDPGLVFWAGYYLIVLGGFLAIKKQTLVQTQAYEF